MFRAGISYDDFGKLTMRKIKIIANAYGEKLKEDFKMADITAFIQGRYFIHALLCTVGNMMPTKNSTKFEYPEQAYSLNQADEQLTEDQIEAQRQAFIASLMTMQHNFEINKQKQETEEVDNA